MIMNKKHIADEGLAEKDMKIECMVAWLSVVLTINVWIFSTWISNIALTWISGWM